MRGRGRGKGKGEGGYGTKKNYSRFVSSQVISFAVLTIFF